MNDAACFPLVLQPVSAICVALQDAMQYTDQQVQDLLDLRRLYGFRRGQLARERKTLLNNLTSCRMDGTSHVCDKLNETAKWSDLLKENGAEEHRSYMQIHTASCRGVGHALSLVPDYHVHVHIPLAMLCMYVRSSENQRSVPVHAVVLSCMCSLSACALELVRPYFVSCS